VGQHWVELRVHGVRATAPEDMLDVDRVVQVAGDELGRVFRRAGRRGERLPEPDGHVVEAYHWGELTSGSFAQALWLLLAPFGLLNAAQFTLPRPVPPPGADPRAPRRWHGLASAALRLTGVAMTALFVLTVGVLTVDLWVWQQARATSPLPYVLALLAPVALLAVFPWAAGPRAPDVRQASRTPAPELPADPAPTDPAPAAGPGAAAAAPEASELTGREFFDGTPHLRALQLLHVAAGLALVAALAASVTTSAVVAAGVRAAAGVLVVVVCAVVTAGVPELDVVATRGRLPHARREARCRRARRTAMVLAVLAGLDLLVALVAVVTAPAGGGTGRLPGVDALACLVMALAVVGVALLAVGNAGLLRTVRAADARPFAPYARGWGCTLLALFGLFLGVGYSGAFSTVAATALTSPERPVVVPELFSRVAYAWGVAVLGMALLVALLVVRRARALPRLAARAVRQHRGRLTRRWTWKVASAMWTARLKNGLGGVLAVFGLLGVLLTVAAALELPPVFGWPAVALPGVLADLSWWPRPGEPWPAPQVAVLTLGTLSLTALATTLLLLTRTALFGAAARRGINVVWDVIAFWPRTAHPFVPSAYSARAVADLEDRVRWHLAADGGAADRVAVCGHSQGSLLAFAALVRLAASPADAALLDRVAFLSFGSQLQVMFARGFPAYVDRAAIQGLFDRLDGRWRNLYRDTDPLAGPVLSWRRGGPGWIGPVPAPRGRPPAGREEFGPDWRLADPVPPADPTLQVSHLLPLRGHGEFWLDPAWYDALAAVGCARTTDGPVRPEPVPAERHRERFDVLLDGAAGRGDPRGLPAGGSVDGPGGGAGLTAGEPGR
jgi:hypothetical protein